MNSSYSISSVGPFCFPKVIIVQVLSQHTLLRSPEATHDLSRAVANLQRDFCKTPSSGSLTRLRGWQEISLVTSRSLRRVLRHEGSIQGCFGGQASLYRRRANMQQLTCNIDLSCSFYYLFFSFVLIELKPFVLKGKALGEKL